jgi:predicted dehydrogenase
MVDVGIVGSGFMAETHVAGYETVPEADVTVVASPNSAATFVEEQGLDARPVASVEELIESDVDAVDVCSPTSAHREHVERALDAGLDVFCEKPLAASLADATAVEAAADAADASLTVGHVLRFFPAYAAVKETVDEGGIGTPGVARARRLSPFPDWGRDDWYADRSQSGGVLLDLAIHDLDYLRWTLGAVERVFARTTGDRREHAHVTLRFESGAVGYVEATWGLPADATLRSELELAGDDGLVEYDSTEGAPVALETAGNRGTVSPTVRDGYARELAAFVEAVDGGGEPPVTAAEAVAAMRLSVAATRSAERGAPVRPAEVEP